MEPLAARLALPTEGKAVTPFEEFWRYLIVSGAALMVDFGLLIGLTELLGVHYLWSGAAGFLVGAGVAYMGSVRWVFARRRLSSPSQEMTVFALIGLGGLGINEVALWSLTGGFGMHYALSKVGAAAAGFLFNFVVRKYLLFR